VGRLLARVGGGRCIEGERVGNIGNGFGQCGKVGGVLGRMLEELHTGKKRCFDILR